MLHELACNRKIGLVGVILPALFHLGDGILVGLYERQDLGVGA